MKKPVTKIICAALASVVALGITAAAACSKYTPTAIDGDYSGEVSGNGGFVVEKGDYVYFINGVESNTADNTPGNPVKGAIMRITKENLKAHNYSSVQTVLPQIAYCANYDSGLFIYGDYMYFSTPSTSVTSDGSVLNGKLELKRVKLDGGEVSDPFITFETLSPNYRYVESEGVVYVMYVASESIYGETSSCTNIHSLNTSTGENRVLAYNVASYLFDAEDKTNPRVYYTMNVTDYSGSSNSTYGYNQIYTVTADETEENAYDFDSVEGWDKDNDRYINCGDLVFDGIGGPVAVGTQFNYDPTGENKNLVSFTYGLETYRHNTLFYTRTHADTTQNSLFMLKDADHSGAEWDAVKNNPENGDHLLADGSSADGYTYVFNASDELESVISSYSSGGIAVNKVTEENGVKKLSDQIDNVNYYLIVKEGSANLLFTDENYLYYSLTGGNGYTFWRIDYTGTPDLYDGMYGEDLVNDYTAVRLLDLDADASWYKPEIVEDHLLFASETDNMSSYNYIMAFDLTEGGSRMDNSAIDKLNKLYDGICGDDGVVSGYSDTEKYPTDLYANLSGAARYLFYTSDYDYIKDLAAACNAKLGEDDDPVYSDKTLAKLQEFLAPSADNDWKDYTAQKEVNGKQVYANTRDYYYTVLGRMNDSDATAYHNSFRSYLKSWPAEEPVVGWYQGLNTPAKVLFIIGMCLSGLIVLALLFSLTTMLIRKIRANKKPVYTKRRIKVDTTDDKDIDVYGNGTDKDNPEEKEEE